jgi:Tannase and feruloyl esterase
MPRGLHGLVSVRLPKCLAAALLALSSFTYLPSPAAESTTGNSLTNDLAKWGEQLRLQGATPSEVSRFQDIIRAQPPEDLPKWEGYLDRGPEFFQSYLKNARRAQAEPTPKPVFPGIAPLMPCAALLQVSIPEAAVESAELSADGSCRVTASVVHPPANNRIKIFMALPSKDWNGRFRGTGGGGYAGGTIASLDAPVGKGYVVAATDTGNAVGNATFALDAAGKQAWSRLRDNAYLGIHDMTAVGKRLTRAFYGKLPRYAYFVGGSTGGRQALTEAQRYPEDYDGILALYPAMARDRYVPALLWPQILMRDANDFLPKEKLDAATAAAIKACGAGEGAKYGVIDDPTRCSYNPAALVGTKMGDGAFTATDAQVIRDIWEGPKAHDGTRLWWGPMRGADLSIVAQTDGAPLQGKPSEEGLDWFRYFLVRDPQWDWRSVTRPEFELLFRQSIEEHSSIYGGDDPDLTAFRARGGKLLIVHGWSDQVVPPQESIAYYRSVEQRMGGPRPISDYMRLFMVPGGDHGFGSRIPSPSPAEMIGALLKWVEQRHAPSQLNADLPGNKGEPAKIRPLFPYR